MPYGHQGSTRGQLKCVGPSNVANATEHYAAAGALVLQNIKLIIQDFEIFSQTLCPPSFMVGGGYFGVRRTAEYDGCCEPNSWMQLNSL